jgi:Rieske 2Fe-2S family protein
MAHIIWPNGPEKCRINCTWLFSKEAVGKPYHPRNAIDFWDKTNLEDWEICEQSQLGIRSQKYEPGPYSGQESILVAYDEHYLRILNKD